MHMFIVYVVKEKYWINSSKTVIGVDRPMFALSMHLQKPLRIIKGNNSHRIGPYSLLFIM